jgi:hypothetical protein
MIRLVQMFAVKNRSRIEVSGAEPLAVASGYVRGNPLAVASGYVRGNPLAVASGYVRGNPLATASGSVPQTLKIILRVFNALLARP